LLHKHVFKAPIKDVSDTGPKYSFDKSIKLTKKKRAQLKERKKKMSAIYELM